MTRKFSSISVETTLASGINSSQTSITVATGTGSTLLGGITLAAGNVDQFTVALDPDTTNEEIVFITAVSSDTFTIVRGRAGTTAVSHSSGATVRHVLTSDDLNAFTTSISPVTNVQFAGSSSGTTTVQASATASGTLSLPAATDTLVGRNTTDTLTNKTISAANNTLTGVVTPSSTDTLTNKTINAANNTLVGIVTASSTDTFTNKDLTSGTNTFPSSLATLTGTQTLTNKTIDYNSNTITNLPVGGQTLLSTTSLSSTETTISNIDLSYKDLLIYVYGVKLSASNDIYFKAYSSGSRPVTHSTFYSDISYLIPGTQSASGILGERVYIDSTGMKLTLPGASNNTTGTNNAECEWVILIRNYTSAFGTPHIEYKGAYLNTSNRVTVVNGSGYLKDSAAISTIKLYANGATLDAGAVKIYGVN